ncbi:plasmid pRiA4b ORF-3 family protein [Geomicrobium sp. JCM 19039]|uniref:plasmid pRiA4b ORF-3 family protein n=1 Tax=Geomicrobium sp. JCM 19039 TaxID=1460636 RepID=UPI00045F131E|nr:plasmid pRiA4b ORF-3 family protein [Geomicrobium sp. JCM 19039]GAK12355.1 TnpR protein [Geomicrobium sp. JCM 19039]
MIFKLNIQLSYLSPAIERTILFDGQTTFGQLHDVIQCAFGWENSHIHDFKVETEEGENVVNLFGNKMKSIITNPDMVFDAIIEPYNEAKEIIADWFNGERDEIEYLYDPGDDWLHTIKLMKVLEGRKECPEIIELSYFAPEEDSRSEWPEDEWMESGNHEVPDQETEEMLMSEKNGMMWSQRFRLGPADLFIDNIWDNLLTETTRFKAAAPWKALNSDDIIAIKHPEMEKMLYCSVMGALGEMYGMAVYQGDEGLQSLLGVLEGTEDGLNQKCLMLSFDNRNDLTNRDYRLIKDAGHTFRGKNAWPLFRSFRLDIIRGILSQRKRQS